MASTMNQRINPYKLDKKHIQEMENLLDIELSTTENDSSDDSGTDTEEEFLPDMISECDFTCKRLETITNNTDITNKPKVGRRPTRKPDPNTCNRNALMARENRKKKKEYVEKLEKNISQYLKQQKKLQKIIKKQAKFIQRLQKEKHYFKNILSNKSEILSLVNAVKQNRTEQISNISNNNLINSHNETPQTSPTYSCSTNECYRSNSFSSQTDCPTSIFDDELNDYNSNNLQDSWDNLLDWNCRMDEKVIQTEYNIQNISDEHNYVNLKNECSSEISENEDIGVCLHINKGKISLEFCPKCNLKSTTKLLSDSEFYEIN